MKLLDKLKNALFEEEYVEVEEKKEVKKKEKPIAKKIIVEDKPKKQAPKEDLIVEEEKKETKVETPNRDFKFKAILDDDFIDLEEKKEPKPVPKMEPKKEEKPKPVKKEVKETRPLYQGDKKHEEKNLYGSLNDNEIKIHEYGSASRQKEKKTFHPSPIISPIYGVLDQNYKKDDIVTKKEVRITSSYKSKNIDVDSVREKAYGNSDDIFEEELTSNKQKEAMKILQQRKYSVELKAKTALVEALKDDEFKNIYNAFNEEKIALAKDEAFGKDHDKELLKSLKAQLSQRLKQLKLSSIEPVYSCKKCKDEGVVDGKYCDCFKKELKQLLGEDKVNQLKPITSENDENIQKLVMKIEEVEV